MAQVVCLLSSLYCGCRITNIVNCPIRIGCLPRNAHVFVKYAYCFIQTSSAFRFTHNLLERLLSFCNSCVFQLSTRGKLDDVCYKRPSSINVFTVNNLPEMLFALNKEMLLYFCFSVQILLSPSRFSYFVPLFWCSHTVYRIQH